MLEEAPNVVTEDGLRGLLAKGYLAGDGIQVVRGPEFVDVDIDGKVRTAIKLVVDPR